MNKKQIIILVIILVAVIGSYFGFNYLEELKTYKNQVAEINISNVNLSKIADGTYTGSHKITWITAEVEVSIKNQQIENIKLLKHENDRGAKAEVIPSKVLKAQSLAVDTVSGATSSSKVILKAIENALTKKSI